MKLPLLFSSSPSVGRGPTVMLARGEWAFEGDYKDSEFMISLDPTTEMLPLQNLVLPCDSSIQLVVTKQGTEREITVYAKKI